MWNNRRQISGFTLLEVLAAIVVLSLAFRVIISVITPTVRRIDADARARSATSYAQSLLARIGADLPLVDGRTTGHDQDLDWSVDITPWQIAAGDTEHALRLSLVGHAVKVSIFWDGVRQRQSYSIDTMRLAVAH